MVFNLILRSLLLLIGSLASASAQNSWTKEPASFSGAKFSSSEEEARKTLKLADCVVRENQEKACFFFFNLAGVDVGATATFERDALVKVSGIFLATEFSTVQDVFLEAYGRSDSAVPGNTSQWNGQKISITLERTVADERQFVVNEVVSAFCEAQHATVAKLDTFNAGLIRKEDEDLQSRGADVSVRARAVIRALENQNSDHDKNVSYATAQCEKFSARTSGLLEIAMNDYTAEVARRRVEDRKKAANSLK